MTLLRRSVWQSLFLIVQEFAFFIASAFCRVCTDKILSKTLLGDVSENGGSCYASDEFVDKFLKTCVEKNNPVC